MDSTTLFLYILTFGFSLWLGLYLLARNFSNVALRLTGFGVIAYSLALIAYILISISASSNCLFTAALLFFTLLPSTLWAFALNTLLPKGNRLHKSIFILWIFVALPIYVASVLQSAATSDISPGIEIILVPVLIFPLLVVFFRFIRFSRQTYPDKWKGLAVIATLFFTLSLGLMISPVDWLPERWMLAAIGIDLEILAYLIAALDAFEEGENLRWDMLRSLQTMLFVTILFGGQIALAMHFVTGITFSMVLLLIGTISTSIVLVTLSSPLSNLFDRLLFNRSAQLRKDRAEMRSASQSLSRANLDIDPVQINEDDFARYTRRALSHFGDLPRLASNPLTRLPLIEERLHTKQSRPDTLNRAAELKLLLTESIHRLKPASSSNFGTSDEWRHYNALHFPYVLGLKPYRHKSAYTDLDPTAEQALDWFQVEVPERTLHNWQNAAAKLVAQDLREQM